MSDPYRDAPAPRFFIDGQGGKGGQGFVDLADIIELWRVNDPAPNRDWRWKAVYRNCPADSYFEDNLGQKLFAALVAYRKENT